MRLGERGGQRLRLVLGGVPQKQQQQLGQVLARAPELAGGVPAFRFGRLPFGDGSRVAARPATRAALARRSASSKRPQMRASSARTAEPALSVVDVCGRVCISVPRLPAGPTRSARAFSSGRDNRASLARVPPAAAPASARRRRSTPGPTRPGSAPCRIAWRSAGGPGAAPSAAFRVAATAPPAASRSCRPGRRRTPARPAAAGPERRGRRRRWRRGRVVGRLGA